MASTRQAIQRLQWPWARAAAASVVVLTALGCTAAWWLNHRAGSPPDPTLAHLFSLAVLTSAGFAVAWTRPRNVIGWLLLAGVVLDVGSLATSAYAHAAYAPTGGRWPLRLAAAWVGSWAWLPSVLIPVAVLPAIYPSGRASSPQLRALTVLGGTAVGVTVLRAAFGPIDPRDLPPAAVLPFRAPGWLVSVLGATAVVLLVASIGLQLVSTAVRARRAAFPTRQQLLLLLAAVAVVPVLFPLSVPESVFIPILSLPGLAVAVGVLRYRLLGITVVLRRGLFYVPLTALVAVTIAGMSALVEHWSPSRPLPQVGAAAVIAVLVVPVAGRLRRIVDRMVLGTRSDPLLAVNSVTARLGRRDDALDSVVAAIADVVDADYVAVESPEGTTLAAHGNSPGQTDRVPLDRGGTGLGALVISHVPDATGRSMVEALAAHVASIVRAQRLSAKLDHARKRAEASRAAERERIRQDMHDGLGPALSGISLSLQAAHRLVETDASAAQDVLLRAREETDAAVVEVRRVIDELRPVAMDAEDLATAVRHTARSMGFGRTDGPAFTLTCGPFVLPPWVEDAAYRIVNEALHNVVRHAHATRCEVTIRCADDVLAVTVADDGVGLCAEPVPGVGLESMHHRAQAAGGHLEVRSPVGTGRRGTVVEARLPTRGLP